MFTQPQTPAAREARRLRSLLRKEQIAVMVCAPHEVEDILAELRPRERERVRLLTSWPWDVQALASLAVCRSL